MPIYVPGKRDRHNRPASKTKRTVVAVLSLTAMVDMFTVLVVFLLQNYRTTGEVINLDKDVSLPKASAVKELKPAHVVIISSKKIMLDKEEIASFEDVKEQQSWMIDRLYQRLTEEFSLADQRRGEGLTNRLKQAVDDAKGSAGQEEDDRRITVQADKGIDFLTIKKVLYTLSEAKASEINFAVIKGEEETN